MATTIPTQETEMIIRLSDASIVNDLKKLLKRIPGVEAITVHKKKTEIDFALEDVAKGNIVEVGTVENLMDFLHS